MVKSIDINTIQHVAVIGSACFILFIVGLIHQRKIKETYSLLWLFFGVVFMVISLWRGSLELIAGMLGIAYAPAALFIILFVALISILIHYSIVLSRQSETIVHLVQEVGLLRMEGQPPPSCIKDSEEA